MIFLSRKDSVDKEDEALLKKSKEVFSVVRLMMERY
jgi:hypothetical protein